MRRRVSWLTGLVLLVASMGAVVPHALPARADPPPTDSVPSGVSPEPSSDVLRATVDLARTTRRLESVEETLAVVQQQLADLHVDLDRLQQHLDETRAAVEAAKARMRDRAVTVYTQSGSGPLLPTAIHDPSQLGAGAAYAEAANGVDRRLVAALERARADLEADRDRRDALRDDLETQSNDLTEARDELRRLRDNQQQLLDKWGAVPVMGTATLTAEQLTAWFASTRITPRLPDGLTVADLARLFIDEGALAGVKGDIAFAQSIIETGSFTEFQGYNFSGIGVCDSCTGGYLFDAARDGVRAQMQLLRSYADPTSRAADLPVPLSPVLYGTDPVDAARRFDTFFLKGAAPLWNEMGKGNWATDPYYAGKVLSTYAKMLAFANSRGV